MKKIIMAVTLLSLAVGFTSAQETGAVKKVQVTEQTLASHPADEPYVIDFTRTETKGAVYEVTADVVSRVRVRTQTQGEVALSELAKKYGITGSKLLLGMGSDVFQQLKLGSGGTSRRLSYNCNDRGYCHCDGFSDCMLMHLDKVCKPDDVLFCEGKHCVCKKR